MYLVTDTVSDIESGYSIHGLSLSDSVVAHAKLESPPTGSTDICQTNSLSISASPVTPALTYPPIRGPSRRLAFISYCYTHSAVQHGEDFMLVDDSSLQITGLELSDSNRGCYTRHRGPEEWFPYRTMREEARCSVLDQTNNDPGSELSSYVANTSEAF
ncbi:hypothetical protein K438DRAFT_1753370 [Mycena galopus ATCC 62051]|nr:hypothetical protein K438DRAFT_1753370 [Mycena galopus ATCC 62051]